MKMDERKDRAPAPDDGEACRERREEMLDEALEETFPASDPPSLTRSPPRPC
jgi:hypothetical protein